MAVQKTNTKKKTVSKGRSTTSKKKPTSKKTNTGTKRKSTAKKQNNKRDFDIKRELIVLSSIIFSIFLVAVAYFNIGGIVGAFVRRVLYGVFGIGGYLIPLFVVAVVLFYILGEKYNGYMNKVLLSFFLIIAMSTIAHIYKIDSPQLNDRIDEQITFFPALSNYFDLSTKSNMTGGFIGGLIGDISIMLFGKFGAKLLMLLIIVSLVIIIFEASLTNLLKGVIKLIIIGIKGFEDYLEKRSKQAKSKNKHFEDVNAPKNDNEVIKEKEDNLIFMNERRKKSNFLEKSTVDSEEDKLDQKFKDLGYIDSECDDVYEEIKKELKPEITEELSNHSENIQISMFTDKKKDHKNNMAQNKPENITKEIKDSKKSSKSHTLYEYPPYDLLSDPLPESGSDNKAEIRHNAQKLQSTLESFGVGANVVNVSCGPTVTRYELQPDVGVKVSKIVNLTDDIALNLAATGIRIEAPIPGKALIGIEVPNRSVKSVFIKEVLSNKGFKQFPSKIAFAVGKDISGDTIIADIAKMPHMLISGATGSGKSVCINTLIISILFRAHPDEVKLLMIDPKVVELKIYNGIPHLLVPVVTDSKKAAGALYWAVQEMEERYQLFAAANVRDLKGYNKAVEEKREGKKLPQIVIIVDELADLMQVAAKDVEEAICRLAQKARAAGIHLILATQRPSVDVITGVIKANVPSRIAFSVSSGVDSRTIIDMNGAEKLVGKGDMLYYPIGMNKPLRVQGAFISDHEVERVVDFLKATEKAEYDKTIIEGISQAKNGISKGSSDKDSNYDAYFEEVLELVIDKEKASASMIQRHFSVGYNRAARIMDQLYDAGYISGEEGSKARKVLITREQLYEMKNKAESDEQGNQEQESI